MGSFSVSSADCCSFPSTWISSWEVGFSGFWLSSSSSLSSLLRLKVMGVFGWGNMEVGSWKLWDLSQAWR